MDEEISLLKEKDKNNTTHYQMTNNNLRTVVKTFTKEVDTFGSNINKLHNHVTNSMTNVYIFLDNYNCCVYYII